MLRILIPQLEAQGEMKKEMDVTLYLLRHGESVANVSRVFAAWLFCENHGFKFEDGHMGRGHLSVMSKAGDRFRLLKFDISPDNLSTIRV